MPLDTFVRTTLVRRYLAFNNYKHTLAVFSPEVGLPAEPLRRQYLAQQTRLPLNVGNRRGAELPLMYALTAKTSGPTPTPAASAASYQQQPEQLEPPPAAAPVLPQRHCRRPLQPARCRRWLPVSGVILTSVGVSIFPQHGCLFHGFPEHK